MPYSLAVLMNQLKFMMGFRSGTSTFNFYGNFTSLFLNTISTILLLSKLIMGSARFTE